MAFASTVASLQEESCCPVCLDYFKDPVTIDCGHNFCCDCLSACWEDLADTFPCPICRFSYYDRSFRRNPQLRSLAEAVQKLGVRRSKRKWPQQPERAACKKHHQALTLFCDKDLELLCTRCSFTPKHLDHHVSPIESAAPHHRGLLEGRVEPLRSRVEQLEKMIALQGSKTLELRKEAEARRREIEEEFEQVRQFLQGEQEAALRKTREEEVQILAEVNRSLGAFSAHASGLKRLLKHVENRSEGSDVAVLRSLKGIEDRWQKLRRPDSCTCTLELSGFEVRLPAQFSGLGRIAQHFRVQVLYDPATAHPQLTVSGDKKTVHYHDTWRTVCYAPRRFYLCPAVLGLQSFTSGRHYWEVEVGTKPKWTLGACRGCLPRNWRNAVTACPGFWALGRCVDTGYLAFGPQKAQIVPKVRPSKIGVFLDYELGEISFYNVDDGSLLHTFHHRFTKTIWPYFYIGRDPEPLKLLSVSDDEM
ncbi:tripartite motif-containing protein 60 [Fukomys damarensis]|uniref:Tripartite motif-containing protein 60 n=1 Tax=Fukomys damarensis TaxID=885580 RepID=A0A091DKR4_FUKDA|nr:tripartite motif-containing protein 60 [Fukomys damarensis]KFO30875.1 Tripartite motif-containing protein 60 [Fukomys damarensis]